jgi:hypothetical protein
LRGLSGNSSQTPTNRNGIRNAGKRHENVTKNPNTSKLFPGSGSCRKAGKEVLIQGEDGVDTEEALRAREPFGDESPPQSLIATQTKKSISESVRIPFRHNDPRVSDDMRNFP